MLVATMPPVRVCHALKCFYFCIDMLYHNTPSRKFLVILLLLFTQFMLFARLYRDEAVRMVFFYPLVS
jgi:hypothetical protein